ncbi:unnamed protein product, partial [marine sediment metagenome]
PLRIFRTLEACAGNCGGGVNVYNDESCDSCDSYYCYYCVEKYIVQRKNPTTMFKTECLRCLNNDSNNPVIGYEDLVNWCVKKFELEDKKGLFKMIMDDEKVKLGS